MQEIKFKIKNTESANVEIVPVADGVEIIVKYGDAAPTPSYETKTTYTDKSKFKFHKKDEDIIEEMKEAAREEYKKKGSDKDEISKFVKFYENKIKEDGWKGGRFDFDVLFERWMSKKK